MLFIFCCALFLFPWFLSAPPPPPPLGLFMHALRGLEDEDRPAEAGARSMETRGHRADQVGALVRQGGRTECDRRARRGHQDDWAGPGS